MCFSENRNPGDGKERGRWEELTPRMRTPGTRRTGLGKGSSEFDTIAIF